MSEHKRESGYYWVLCQWQDDAVIAYWDDGGEHWWHNGMPMRSTALTPVYVIEGPIQRSRAPSWARRSGCPHPDEFLRGRRCVLCQTVDITGSVAKS